MTANAAAMEVIEQLQLTEWDTTVAPIIQGRATDALERGKILFLPGLRFELLPQEAPLLSAHLADARAKNISLDVESGALRGVRGTATQRVAVQQMMARFASQSRALLHGLLPDYEAAVEPGRTSLRPVEIAGRAASRQTDDTLLHVDAFPATPVRDRRLLRIFSNVNAHGADRVWRVGAPFEEVATHFMSRLRDEYPGEIGLLHALGLTRSRRSHYDHLMLQLHNRMKADAEYQATVAQREIRFPSGSTWMVFSDQVSHAALSGQAALEQTFYLPVDAMADPSRSPLRVLERLCGRRLISF